MQALAGASGEVEAAIETAGVGGAEPLAPVSDAPPHVLEGFLVQQYPQYDGKKVRFELDCASTPGDDEVPFLRAAGNFAAGEGITFVVNVIQG